MVDLSLAALWLVLNGFVLFVTYRTIKVLNQSYGYSSDGDGVSPPSSSVASMRQEQQTSEAEVLDVNRVRCSNCGQEQEAGFVFCENCIKPLYR